MQEIIGFEQQSTGDGACGKYALRHALLLLGIPVSQREANVATQVPPWKTMQRGTNEADIKRGLREFGCTGIEYTGKSRRSYAAHINHCLKNGLPVIITAENDEHWAVIAGKKSRTSYYWIDSADPDLIGAWHWDDILNWVDNEVFYGIGVQPRSKDQLVHSLVPRFSEFFQLMKDTTLRQYWGYYLDDLYGGTVNGLSPRQFFDAHRKNILDTICIQYPAADRETITWELKNYETVAVAHNLVPSLIELTAALTLIAVGIE
jgi:hypothetical protein